MYVWQSMQGLLNLKALKAVLQQAVCKHLHTRADIAMSTVCKPAKSLQIHNKIKSLFLPKNLGSFTCNSDDLVWLQVTLTSYVFSNSSL